jgi:hypothetical protein
MESILEEINKQISYLKETANDKNRNEKIRHAAANKLIGLQVALGIITDAIANYKKEIDDNQSS